MSTIKHFSLALLIALLAAACASAGKGDKLQEAQYAYSAAIRWGDFEGAWSMVDPVYRDAHPMGTADFERYKQVQVSGYRDMATRTLADGTVVREIQLGVIDRDNMTQHDTRYTERWRYDEPTRGWVLTTGLPQIAP